MKHTLTAIIIFWIVGCTVLAVNGFMKLQEAQAAAAAFAQQHIDSFTETAPKAD